MKRKHTVADRFARAGLGFLAAANLLFVLSLLVALLSAGGRARAEAVACEGTDLIEELASEDPALLERIRQRAASTPNGEGLLWRVEGGDGAPPSYLFGTMHLTDPRVLEIAEPVRDAFDDARTVALETTDVLDDARMFAAMSKIPELTMFPADESLTDHLDEEERDIVSAALAEQGVPLQSVVKMKPWMLVSLVALPDCELRRQQAGAPVLDRKLAKQAMREGKRLVGLETTQEQLAAFASLPMEHHIEALVGVLQLGGRVDNLIETLTGLYLDGQTGMFQPTLEALLKREGQYERGYASFEQKVITMRNRVMAERAAPLLNEGGSFIAVGAMHLPGEEGLIALLREAGYGVTRADK